MKRLHSRRRPTPPNTSDRRSFARQAGVFPGRRVKQRREVDMTVTNFSARTRRNRAARLALLALLPAFVLMAFGGLAPAAHAETAPPAAGEAHAGGEANLVLPDLSQAEFVGVNGRTLLMGGLLVCALGFAFGLV